jgi:aromatic-L-amino-acid decarboxylase
MTGTKRPMNTGKTKIGSSGSADDAPRVPDEQTLDPDDWHAFRQAAHATLDHCIDFIAAVRDRPVWKSVPEETKSALKRPVPYSANSVDKVLEEFRDRIMPYSTGNVHPRFFGWVHGAGTPMGIISAMLSATMNSNCGGREHAAIYVERQVIEWCREIFGLPDGGSGVLTVGTSMASVIAVAVARFRQIGPRARQEGNGHDGRLVGYCSSEAHVALRKAFELLGLGSAHLRAIPTEENFAISLEQLSAAIKADRASGLVPFMVIGTAGTVNTGAFDDLSAIAELARREDLWFHVDGAFGAWARIAGQPWKHLVRGIECADSVAFDFHKWISVPYDAGCVLIRDERLHRAAFTERPEYLKSGVRGLAAGEPWPCDYGIDLSRDFRALKVWMAFSHFGVDQLGRMITKNCQAARHLGSLIDNSAVFELAAPVSLNICCFGLRNRSTQAADDQQIARLVEQLQLSGIAAPSTARIRNRLCVRVAILNHRTGWADLDLFVKAAEDNLRSLS